MREHIGHSINLEIEVRIKEPFIEGESSIEVASFIDLSSFKEVVAFTEVIEVIEVYVREFTRGLATK